MAVAHYLDALAWQREVVKLHAIFGGKNPHPNFLVGGAPAPDLGEPDRRRGRRRGDGGQRRDADGSRARSSGRCRAFVDQVYVPDTLAIAGFYKDWFKRGEGVGNFMTYGEFPLDGKWDAKRALPAGVILDRDLSHIDPVDLNDPAQVQEFVSHSWYDYAAGKDAGLHPYDGETALNYSGPKPPYDQLEVDKGYSWLKSPRWRGKAMEVGPLARVLMLYASGHAPTKELVGFALKKLDQPIEALYSTLGRTAARTLETKIIADPMQGWHDALVANIKAGDVAVQNAEKWEPSTWPRRGQGRRLHGGAARRRSRHWIVIRDGKIANYQAVVPTTWNAGPRDPTGQPGAYEAALADRHRLAVPKQPLEILRTIHTFDPCIACAVHVADPNGEPLIEIEVS